MFPYLNVGDGGTILTQRELRSGPDPQNLEVKNNRESEMSDEKQIWIDTDVKKPPIEFPVQCRSNWCPLMGPGAMGI